MIGKSIWTDPDGGQIPVSFFIIAFPAVAAEPVSHRWIYVCMTFSALIGIIITFAPWK